MKKTRTEQDSMGTLEVPADALYGAQTQRAVDNFPVSGQAMPKAFIQALLHIKAAAARAHITLDKLPPQLGEAIAEAADQLRDSPQLMQHFPVDIYQTGSGTSSNMNANEVLATLASRQLGQPVSANDHVNYGQSSNDVIPTAIHVSAALLLDQALLPALSHLSQTIRDKADQVSGVIKTGRTHLMDAMPVQLSQSLEGWATQIDQNRSQLIALQPLLHSLAQGGTAVGTGVNAAEGFATTFCQVLSAATGLTFTPAASFFAHMSSQDIAVALSGQLKTLAVSLMKIANDLRWMNSGPLAGLAEIELEALQPGSSIMPGKVNPVIPEAVTMVAARVMGNDTSITVAGQSGNFELNVMLPLIAHSLLDSLSLLANACQLLADKAISSFRINQTQMAQALSRNPILVTALNPEIGYLKAAAIAKKAYTEQRPIVDVAEEETELDRETLCQLLDPEKLTKNP
ncbi:class II fumarate hydratase [Pontibacter sp. JAM-7]|uniref:class II fumarate hydratase n=1 Tax=Pontibacter sp. JAM-7 TaxID=3366581 RepID=UPI003AF9ED02